MSGDKLIRKKLSSIRKWSRLNKKYKLQRKSVNSKLIHFWINLWKSVRSWDNLNQDQTWKNLTFMYSRRLAIRLCLPITIWTALFCKRGKDEQVSPFASQRGGKRIDLAVEDRFIREDECSNSSILQDRSLVIFNKIHWEYQD